MTRVRLQPATSLKVIGLLVIEKLSKWFLPYMDLAAILVIQPGPFEQNLVSHPKESPYEI